MLDRLRFIAPVSLSLAIFLPSNASAETVEEFYRGKTITLLEAFNPGGTSADLATFLAEHMPKYIPGNPKITIQFMPGGGGITATNHFYNAMPRDGTTLLTPDQAIVVTQHLSPEVVKYDAAKMNWVGIAAPSRSVLMVRKDAGVESVDDLKSKEIFVGASSVGSETYFFPVMTNKVLGAKMNVVPGFPGGTAEVLVSVESGEMHGSVTGWTSWARNPALAAQLNPIITYGEGREPSLPDVPNMIELTDQDEDKQIVRFLSSVGVIGRGIVTTPDVPEDRLQALREAYAAVLQDPEFRAKAVARGVSLDEPMSGEEATALVREALNTPDDVIARAKEMTSESK